MAAIAIDVVLGAVLVAGAVLIAKKAKQKEDTSAQV